jgi:hypothetical protein
MTWRDVGEQRVNRALENANGDPVIDMLVAIYCELQYINYREEDAAEEAACQEAAREEARLELGNRLNSLHGVDIVAL